MPSGKKAKIENLPSPQPAKALLPNYELDDGPLTGTQLHAIRRASPATSISNISFTQKLF
ncbi:hypothetical protein ABAC402_02345 [Asticcacaulis sp. AC402]|nr:hypothetical protein ABAC402_02345 [Asticcacaulis sp. AC402]